MVMVGRLGIKSTHRHYCLRDGFHGVFQYADHWTWLSLIALPHMVPVKHHLMDDSRAPTRAAAMAAQRLRSAKLPRSDIIVPDHGLPAHERLQQLSL